MRDEQGRPRHVVANCDESEPGTFKDRVLLENDPFAVVEALTVAGLAVGAETGWIYLRGEYPLAHARLAGAVTSARAAGLLGPDVAGSGRRFDVELRRGAGAYICGEETALFNSIEGFRGEPRNKPPFPTTHGLFGQPTAINNPETLVNVLDVLTLGVDGYRAAGTERSPGTKLFCLSGRVQRPGLYEVPFGVDPRRAAGPRRRAGGERPRRRAPRRGCRVLRRPRRPRPAAHPGGHQGGRCVARVRRGDGLRPVGRHGRRRRAARRLLPSRVVRAVRAVPGGTVRQHEIVVEIARTGASTSGQRDLLDDIAAAMTDASICGLGHTAAGAVRSAIRLGLVG